MREFLQPILVIAAFALAAQAVFGVIYLIDDVLGWSEWINRWLPLGVMALIWWIAVKIRRSHQRRYHG